MSSNRNLLLLIVIMTLIASTHCGTGVCGTCKMFLNQNQCNGTAAKIPGCIWTSGICSQNTIAPNQTQNTTAPQTQNTTAPNKTQNTTAPQTQNTTAPNQTQKTTTPNQTQSVVNTTTCASKTPSTCSGSDGTNLGSKCTLDSTNTTCVGVDVTKGCSTLKTSGQCTLSQQCTWKELITHQPASGNSTGNQSNTTNGSAVGNQTNTTNGSAVGNQTNSTNGSTGNQTNTTNGPVGNKTNTTNASETGNQSNTTNGTGTGNQSNTTNGSATGKQSNTTNTTATGNQTGAVNQSFQCTEQTCEQSVSQQTCKPVVINYDGSEVTACKWVANATAPNGGTCKEGVASDLNTADCEASRFFTYNDVTKNCTACNQTAAIPVLPIQTPQPAAPQPAAPQPAPANSPIKPAPFVPQPGTQQTPQPAPGNQQTNQNQEHQLGDSQSSNLTIASTNSAYVISGVASMLLVVSINW